MAIDESLPASVLPPGSVFEWGGISALPDICADLGLCRPVVVTDRGLAATAMIAAIVAECQSSGLALAVFAEIDGNPTVGQVRQGLEAVRAGAHDGVVAIGGGSALDAGKAIAFAAGQDRPLFDFALDRHGGEPPEAASGLAWIAIPTTAGTGSEVSPSAVITDINGAKRSVLHDIMTAPRVLCDPGLTAGLPATLTAWTGIDALAHCLEALCAPGQDVEADHWALAGIRRIDRSLVCAFEHGSDRRARTDMMAAALLGGRAFRKGLGGLHALSHALAARFGGQHGLLNAVLLREFVHANCPAIDAQLMQVAGTLELPQRSATGTQAWLADLLQRLRIPTSLAAIGIEWSDAELVQLCAAAVSEPNAAGNPQPIDIAWARRVLLAVRGGSV